MIELSPYYFSSTDDKNSFTISYYPINQKWKIVITNKNKMVEYWLDNSQAQNIVELLSESLNDNS